MTDTQTHSIPIKTAVSNAMQFIRELYADNQIKAVLLEEVEFSEPADQWLITIGFTVNKIKIKENSSSSLADLILPERETVRKYKIVHIDAQSGKPISMKIREI
jgi:hypothetical protein